MSPKRHVPGTPIVAFPRFRGACMALGAYAIVLLVPSTLSSAAPQVDSSAGWAHESGQFIVQDIHKTGRWKIVSIVPPENSQELGTIVFGEGESLLEPSALMGPR